MTITAKDMLAALPQGHPGRAAFIRQLHAEPRQSVPIPWRCIASFFIHGIPKGQPRPRAFVRNGHAAVYDAGTAEGWKSAIAIAAKTMRPSSPLCGPVRVDAVYCFPRPKRLLRKCSPSGMIPHTAKPDRDNLDKATLDALTQIGFWRDDAQVCDGVTRKVYVAKDEAATGAWIRISVPVEDEK